jgi:hypothetical protein
MNTNTSNTPSRRPSDSIRDRGREILERERLREEFRSGRGVEEENLPTSADFFCDGARRWESVFDDGVEERVRGRGREYFYVSEGPAGQEVRRRREGSWFGERRGGFWS